LLPVAGPEEVVLVLGSHPPVPSPAAAATVAALRRELRNGRKVVTAAPRASAATLTVPLAGPAAAWRLERARRGTGAARLVLAVEPGIPLASPLNRLASSRVMRRARPLADVFTLLPLRAALRRFDHVALVVSDTSHEVRRVVAWLRRRADEVVLTGAAASAPPPQKVAVRVEPAPSIGVPIAGVTPLGPPEPTLVRFRGYVAEKGRRVLGPAYVPLRWILVPLEKAIGVIRTLKDR